MAIKQSAYSYADIYGTHRARGCIMAAEVLYERIGTTGSLATCPALKWVLSRRVVAEGNSQGTAERSEWDEHFLSVDRFPCCVESQISTVCSNKHTSESITSIISSWEGAAVTAGTQTFYYLNCHNSATWIITEDVEALHCYIMSFLICHCLNWHLIFFPLQTQWLNHFWVPA